MLNDSYSFLGSASVKGKIDGGGGSDALDYTASLAPVTVNLQAKTATRTGGFLNLEQFQGSGFADTLIAVNAVNAWLLNGSGSGTIASQIIFGNFENLTGGSQADSFVLVGGDWLGILKGGAGQDTVQADSTRVNRWVNLGLGKGTLNGNPFESVEFCR